MMSKSKEESAVLYFRKHESKGDATMLTVQQMQLIQNLKLQGYTKSEIIAYYTSQGLKPPSRPTLQKYYDMDVLPENPGEKLAKDKAFDAEPFRGTPAGPAYDLRAETFLPTAFRSSGKC